MSNTRYKQVGGSHYRDRKIQAWDASQDWMTEEQFIGYLWGTAIKYIQRWPYKGGVEDLEKCLHYLEKLVELLKSKKKRLRKK